VNQDFPFFPETQLWQLLIIPKIGYVVWSQIEALILQQKLFTGGASTSNVSSITARRPDLWRANDLSAPPPFFTGRAGSELRTGVVFRTGLLGTAFVGAIEY
jgi:hypothetical protein